MPTDDMEQHMLDDMEQEAYEAEAYQDRELVAPREDPNELLLLALRLRNHKIRGAQ